MGQIRDGVKDMPFKLKDKSNYAGFWVCRWKAAAIMPV